MDLGGRQDHVTDDEGEAEADDLVGLDDQDHAGHEEDEDEDEDLEDEALASPSQATPLPNLDPPPPYLREISTLASWTVSSSKPGCSIPQLRHANTNLFWQSDGPQPHYLNIHFFKLVRIVGLRLYLDFEQDESYTPTRIIFLAGSGMNDLQEWGEMRLESPRGWIWADFSGVGDVDSDDDDEHPDQGDNDDHEDGANPPLTTANTQRHHLLTDATTTTTPAPTQTPHRDLSSDSENAILENHQNGKDTHLRGLQVFARNDEDGVGGGAGAGVEKKTGNGVVVVRRDGGGEKERRREREERVELGGGVGGMGYGVDIR
ncbi:hypothetical protein COCVIDRAFT_105662 [Bipolaris victoriae FI3]|uniref:DOC domain-containing protein n=1 Tax=Bipolaris victoriae (strain FI3) TaxID=930091 RepID=W7E2N2_BIPV3|nr:hypothetical protein COCVIDRAFT_105662 [Bipolaris victoriae FI3]